MASHFEEEMDAASEFFFSLARRASDVFFRNSNNRRTVKSILLVKTFLGLVEMTSGLVKIFFARGILLNALKVLQKVQHSFLSLLNNMELYHSTD